MKNYENENDLIEDLEISNQIEKMIENIQSLISNEIRDNIRLMILGHNSIDGTYLIKTEDLDHDYLIKKIKNQIMGEIK